MVHRGERRIHGLVLFAHIEDFLVLLQITPNKIEQSLLLNVMSIAFLNLNELLL